MAGAQYVPDASLAGLDGVYAVGDGAALGYITYDTDPAQSKSVFHRISHDAQFARLRR
jgi:hypothetical protein